jgi:hypothetical protein
MQALAERRRGTSKKKHPVLSMPASDAKQRKSSTEEHVIVPLQMCQAACGRIAMEILCLKCCRCCASNEVEELTCRANATHQWRGGCLVQWVAAIAAEQARAATDLPELARANL